MVKMFFQIILLFLLSIECSLIHAQPDSRLELSNKSKQYEKRKLRAEKTGEKKLSLPGRILQNTFTHYNYYFNANNRLNEVIERAKASFKDDFTQLLPFYNYSLDATATEQGELDSVIYKSTAGILLHDLRNDWIDNMYLLLGKAYFFRKDFDSANAVFQYINYAFAPKEEGGYDIPIGSNVSNQNGIFTIATQEKKRLLSKPPTRNEALLWLIRAHLEQENVAVGNGIIQILRQDPNFPKRLTTKLDELAAYSFYKQRNYDSAAAYLIQTLESAEDATEKARREFLVAQLYHLTGQHIQAINWFNESAKHTNDPVMEVFANLNAIKADTSGSEKFLSQKLDNLLKMARREKYENYRDIIYHTAAQLQLVLNDYTAATQLLHKSIQYNNGNTQQKNISFLLLGNIHYDGRLYTEAYRYYDSINTSTLSLSTVDKNILQFRKPILKNITENILNVNIQDSLQYLAKLPDEERFEVIRKRQREQRKLAGLKEDDNENNNVVLINSAQQPDLFNINADKTEWYFNNATLKGNGFRTFRTRWGNRPNVDNWRRLTAIKETAAPIEIGMDPDRIDPTQEQNTAKQQLNIQADLSIPLTPEQLQASDSIIEQSLYKNAKIFQEQLQDAISAIAAYQELLKRFPKTKLKEEALFQLHYNYKQNKNNLAADSVAAILKTKYGNGNWVKILLNPASVQEKETQATKTYERIYNLFIEGSFSEAEQEKLKADSILGSQYWTPQLLFIESIYYVKQKEDSIAINRLTQLISLHATSPLAERAKTMIDVLKRRNEIESYLANLDIERKQPDYVKSVDITSPVIINNPQKDLAIKDTIRKSIQHTIKDTVAVKQPVITTLKQFTFIPTDQHFAMLLLDKVDPVFSGEAKNAFNRYNKEKFYNQPLTATSIKLDDRYQLLLIGSFTDAATAVEYIDNIKPFAGSRIIPWLNKEKYSYYIINQTNLNLLLENKEVENYRKLLQQALPQKF